MTSLGSILGWRISCQLAGAAFGAGLASLVHAATPAATPAFGPPLMIAFGYEVPVLSAIFGVLGVLLARRVAPPTEVDAKLGRDGRAALTLLLLLGVLALIIAGQKQPIVALGWSAGLGYTGITVIELLGAAVVGTVRTILKLYSRVVVAVASAWAERKVK